MPRNVLGMFRPDQRATEDKSPAVHRDLYRWLRDLLLTVNVSTPIGCIQQYAGTTAPNGWLLCDGSAVSRATYAGLFAVLGTTFGGGGTTFNVPDLRGRSPIGVGTGSGLTVRALADENGAETHAHADTFSVDGHAISVSEMPSHNHEILDAGAVGTSGAASAATRADPADWSRSVTSAGGGDTHAHGLSGAVSSVANMSPFLVLNMIIKT